MGLQDREYMRSEPIKPLAPIVPWWDRQNPLENKPVIDKPIMAWYCNKCDKYVKTKAKYSWFGHGEVKFVCAECGSKDIKHIEYVSL